MQVTDSEGELVDIELSKLVDIELSKLVDMTDMFKDAHSIIQFPILYILDRADEGDD